MKNIIQILLAGIVLASVIGCRKNDKVGFELRKNCTGDYIKLDGEYYKICNPEMVANYNDGERININFRLLRNCNGSGNVPSACYLLFPFKAWLQITKVK